MALQTLRLDTGTKKISLFSLLKRWLGVLLAHSEDNVHNSTE